jgi:hypothetical protein
MCLDVAHPIGAESGRRLSKGVQRDILSPRRAIAGFRRIIKRERDLLRWLEMNGPSLARNLEL